MLVTFTDYGWKGPYLGQLMAVLHKQIPHGKIINLMSDAPSSEPKPSAYLLAAATKNLDPDTVILAIVDPGVGNFQDRPVIIKADQRWYIGPDNGLFDMVCRRSSEVQCWYIDWRPEHLSKTFHGRDLYAPVAAMVTKGEIPGSEVVWEDVNGWPDDLYEIIYIDNFGNAMTGIRSDQLDDEQTIKVNKTTVRFADTFSSVTTKTAFWYRNSQGYIEIAVNKGSAEEVLHLQIGAELSVSG